MLTDSEDDSQEIETFETIGVEHGVALFEHTIIGKPIPYPRPEFMSWIRDGRLCRKVVNPIAKLVVRTRNDIKEALKRRHGLSDDVFPLFDNAPHGVVVICEFYRRMTDDSFRSHNRANGLKQCIVNAFSGNQNTDVLRPDIDNMLKFAMEVLMGVAYTDDSMVVKTVTYKRNDLLPPNTGRTIIKFRPFVPEFD